MAKKRILSPARQFGPKWCANTAVGQFLKEVAPLYMRALSEDRMQDFFLLFTLIYDDRFPNVHQTYNTEWRNSIRRMVVWAGPICGANYAEPQYKNWFALMTVQHDRKRRRHQFIKLAYKQNRDQDEEDELNHQQYNDHVITPLERRVLLDSYEEHFQASIADLEAALSTGRPMDYVHASLNLRLEVAQPAPL